MVRLATKHWEDNVEELIQRGGSSALLNYLRDEDDDIRVLNALLTRGSPNDIRHYLSYEGIKHKRKAMNRFLCCARGVDLASYLILVKEEPHVKEIFLIRATGDDLLTYLTYKHEEEVFQVFLERATPLDFVYYTYKFGKNERIMKVLRELCRDDEYRHYVALMEIDS